jgi:hypothetical protein
MRNLMLTILCLCAVGALVRAGFKFYYRDWVPAVLIMVISLSAIGMIVAFLLLLRRLDVPTDAAESAGERIVLLVSGDTMAGTLSWALGFFLSAVGVVECPDALWTRWLAYPAAFVLLLLMGLMLLITMGQKLERVVADSKGIMVLTESRGLKIPGDTDPETRVEWKQVGAVRRVEVRRKTTVSHRSSLENDSVRHEFVLLDHKGRELLDIEEPLDPPERYKLFLDSIPRWTGLQVEQTSVTR